MKSSCNDSNNNNETSTNFTPIESDTLPSIQNYNIGDTILLLRTNELYTLKVDGWSSEGNLNDIASNATIPDLRSLYALGFFPHRDNSPGSLFKFTSQGLMLSGPSTGNGRGYKTALQIPFPTLTRVNQLVKCRFKGNISFQLGMYPIGDGYIEALATAGASNAWTTIFYANSSNPLNQWVDILTVDSLTSTSAVSRSGSGGYTIANDLTQNTSDYNWLDVLGAMVPYQGTQPATISEYGDPAVVDISGSGHIESIYLMAGDSDGTYSTDLTIVELEYQISGMPVQHYKFTLNDM